MGERTLEEIAALIGADIVGDGKARVSGLGSLGTAVPGQLSHLSNPAYRHHLADTRATAVMLKPEDVDACPVNCLVTPNPYLSFARASQLFAVEEPADAGVHPRAVVDPSASVDATASVGANVVIGRDTVVAAGARILANSVVGDRCVIGERVELRANVTLYSDVDIGADSIVHSGAVIGADGFGFTPNETGEWQEIAQVGGVRIGRDVSIGANTCIDRGAIEHTVVEDGVKIDNHVQIGHNCHIGAHSLLCGQVGFAGSTAIGRHCVFGGRSGAGGDHPVTICDNVMVSSCTVISQSVERPGIYSGSMLFHEHGKWRRNALRMSSLDDLFKRVKRLEKKNAG